MAGDCQSSISFSVTIWRTFRVFYFVGEAKELSYIGNGDTAVLDLERGGLWSWGVNELDVLCEVRLGRHDCQHFERLTLNEGVYSR